MHAIIVGAGPAGLAAALALHQESKTTPSSIIHITVLELRSDIQTLGGAINLTPLAMRYLDAIGVGARLRPLGVKVGCIELLSHRTGGSLGRLWPDVDALRVSRHGVVEAMLQTVRELPDAEVKVRYGVKVESIDETGDAAGVGSVKVHLKDELSGADEVLEGDFLLGCDGIHSFVRSSVVDPGRTKEYSGKAGAYGYIDLQTPSEVAVTRPDGAPAVTDTTLVSGQRGSLLMSFFEPLRRQLYVAAVISEKEKTEAREGWKAMGADKEALKADFLRRFSGGKLQGLEDLVKSCEEWFFFPVYMLPSGGVWVKGRVLLIGDAAHAMPPQGESTGVAIEDGILLAHVFSRRESRSVAQLFADYEALRRDAIKKIYDETMFRWNDAGDRSWLKNVLMDGITWVYLMLMNRWSKDHFSRDVRNLALPS